MGEPDRPMPQITVRDPRRPERPADVLVSGGDERPPADPVVRRRRRRIAGALLLAGAVGFGGLEVRDRRAAAEEDRRLDAIVELRAVHQGGSSSFDPASRIGRLTLELALFNDGPRDLEVTAAAVAGYELVAREIRVAAGSSRAVALTRSVTCEPGARPSTPTGGLQLSVRTASGERRLDLDLPVDEQEVLRLCGFRPLETMQLSFGTIGRPALEVVDLELDLMTQAIGPVQLVGIRPPPGIAAEQLVQGRVRGLPLELTSHDGLTRRLTVTLRFTVHDCSAARTPSEADLPPGRPVAGLQVQVQDQDGSVGDFAVSYPGRLLESLISESCLDH